MKTTRGIKVFGRRYTRRGVKKKLNKYKRRFNLWVNRIRGLPPPISLNIQKGVHKRVRRIKRR